MTQYDIIANGLVEWMANNPSAAHLLSEVKIAHQWGVSRMTARAAVTVLKDNGLVYSEHQKTCITGRVIRKEEWNLARIPPKVGLV